MTMIPQNAPIQLIVALLKDDFAEDEILNVLKRLEFSETVNVVDLLILKKLKRAGTENEYLYTQIKNETLNLTYPTITGDNIRVLLGIGGSEENITEDDLNDLTLIFDENYYGLDLDGVESIKEDLPEETSVLFVLLEHTWMIPLKKIIKNTGGKIFAQDFLNSETLLVIGRKSFF